MTIILLTYLNRSGSTYLANLLSASDSVCVCPEGDQLVSLFLESPAKAFRLDDQWKEKLAQLLQSDRKLKTWGIRDEVFHHLEGANTNIDAFVAFLSCYQLKQKPGASSILFKAERLVDLFNDIERCRNENTDVKYISLIRDPRAVYASQKRTMVPGTNRKMSENPVFTAIFWNHFIRVNKKNMGLSGGHQVFYHDLVRNMEGTISGLSGFLALDFKGLSPRGGDLPDRLPDEHKPIHQNISEIPDPRKINQWKEELSQEEIHLIEWKCKKLLIDSGFEISRQDTIHLAESTKVIYFTIIFRILRFKKIFVYHLRRIFS